MGARFDRLRIRLLTVQYLRDLREYYSAKELTGIFRGAGLPLKEPILSRYMTGRVLPSLGRARRMLGLLQWFLEDILERILVMDGKGVVNVYNIAFNLPLLRLTALRAYMEFRDLDVDVVLTAAVNGIPIATLTADLLGARLSVAKHDMDAGVGRFVEARYFTPNPPRYQSLYVSVYTLPPKSSVLIVDDLLQSGRTLQALLELTRRIGTKPVGVYSIVAVGTAWRSVLENLGNGLRVCVVKTLS